MKYFFHTLWVIFYFSTPGFTQTETTGWVKGYIITSEGDTLRGQLFNRDTETTPDYIQYRQSEQTRAITYSVANTKAFYLQPTDEQFISQVLMVDKTPHTLKYLQNNANPVLVKDTLFLKRLVTGNPSLYYHQESSGKEHFWLKSTDKDFEELILIKYRNSNNDVQTQERYKQQLYLATGACPSLQSKLKWLSFRVSELKQFINELNQCYGNSIVQPKVKKSKSLKTDFGLLVGSTKTVLELGVPNNYYGQAAGQYLLTDSKLRMSAGLWFNLYLPANRQQWSLCNELTFQTYNANYFRTSAQTTPDITMDIQYLRLFTAIRWQLLGSVRLQPYIMFGIVNSAALSIQSNSRATGERKYEQAIAGAVGVKFLRFFAEIRHDRGNGMSNLDNVSTATRTTGLFAGFKF